MKIYIRNQQSKFKKHLDFCKELKVFDYDKSRLKEKITTIHIYSKKSFSELNFDFLFDYKIFPKNLFSSICQWTLEKRKMQIGDTIVQQIFLPPHKTISQKIIVGVRIYEIFDHVDKKGFSYETLEGHVEKGISTFTIERHGDKIIFKIHTFSKPGNLFLNFSGPFFPLPYQTFCTYQALKNVKQQIESQ